MLWQDAELMGAKKDWMVWYGMVWYGMVWYGSKSEKGRLAHGSNRSLPNLLERGCINPDQKTKS